MIFDRWKITKRTNEYYSFTHSLNRLTSDGSLRHPDITDHWPCPSQHLHWARCRPSAARRIHAYRGRPLGRFQSGRPVIWSVTCTGVDCQTKCFIRTSRFLQTTYAYADILIYQFVADSAANVSLLGLVYHWCICYEIAYFKKPLHVWRLEGLKFLFIQFREGSGLRTPI